MKNHASVIALWVLLSQSSQLQAQSGIRHCGDAPTAIAGVVVDSTTGAPVQRALVRVYRDSTDGYRCFVSATPDGRFLLLGRMGGVDSITASAYGFRRFFSQAVRIQGQDTVRVRLALMPGGLLDDCRASEHCRDWLSIDAGPDADLTLRALATQTAIVLAWKQFELPFNAYACLPAGTPDIVLEAVRALHSRTVQENECRLLSSSGGESRRERLRHIATGEPAFSFSVNVTREAGFERNIQLSHYAGPLSGERWECTFRRTGDVWTVSSCTIRGISD